MTHFLKSPLLHKTLVVAISTGALACTPPESVRPVAPNTAGVAAEDEIAAVYSIPATAGDGGTIKIYSEGAYDADDNDRTMVEVTFIVRNRRADELRLDAIRLSAHTDEGRFNGLPPSERRGPERMPADSLSEVDVYFALPDDVSPQDVDRFDVDWSLSSPDVMLEKTTTFREENHREVLRWRYETTPPQP